jgi:hypothetical protein
VPPSIAIASWKCNVIALPSNSRTKWRIVNENVSKLSDNTENHISLVLLIIALLRPSLSTNLSPLA